MSLPMSQRYFLHTSYLALLYTDLWSIAPTFWRKAQIQRHSVSQQNYAQLCHYAQQENTLNFYSVRPALYTYKFSVNLLA
jgi:hypothetical protein